MVQVTKIADYQICVYGLRLKTEKTCSYPSRSTGQYVNFSVANRDCFFPLQMVRLKYSLEHGRIGFPWITIVSGQPAHEVSGHIVRSQQLSCAFSSPMPETMTE